MRNGYLTSSLNSVLSLDLDTTWPSNTWNSPYYFYHHGHKTRYQQKQLKEREEKLQSLYNDQDKEKSVTQGFLGLFSLPAKGGKVRQLFEERRKGPGWDRSRPLQPLLTHSLDRSSPSPQPLTKLPNIGSQMESKSKPQLRIPSPRQKTHPNDQVTSLTKSFSRLSTSSRTTTTVAKDQKQKLEWRASGTCKVLDKVESRLQPMGSMKLHPLHSWPFTAGPGSFLQGKEQAPMFGQRTAPKIPVSEKVEQQRQPIIPLIPSPSKIRPSTAKPTPVKQKYDVDMTKRGVSKVNQPAHNVEHKPTDPNHIPCQICGRYFNNERIQMHEKICKKTSTKRRKVFDPVKHRLEGTEAESYMRKPKLPVKPKVAPKLDWRKKHEEFIASIRAAKEAQAYVAKGGKISDLPPPPPMDTSDYIQCPHCGRKFSESASERHIPKCAKITNNKAKPNSRGPVQRKR